jgi:dephospho-CoA kinase
MLRVALTGGIGSGKSSAAEIFAALGAVVVDSDEIARKVLDRESVGFGEVVAAFGRRN